MIVGAVNTYREALIPLDTLGSEGREQEVEAIVDTGFTGTLALPTPLILRLDLPFRGRGCALMADGTGSLFDVYEGAVLREGRLRRVLADAVDSDPLAGMGLLYDHKWVIQVVEAGTVRIEALL
ncbi:MAG TPA: clan AA aspartic protease [Terriglobia bacterium]|nr:clan AA aspartic protease [Terriglobia bacterium]